MPTVPTAPAAMDIAAAVETLHRNPRYGEIAEPLADLLTMAAPYVAGPVAPPAQTWTGKALRIARAVLTREGARHDA
ncbi:MAG TPA: hypothetical protein VIK91_16505 [Nannocystis sp.]